MDESKQASKRAIKEHKDCWEHPEVNIMPTL